MKKNKKYHTYFLPFLPFISSLATNGMHHDRLAQTTCPLSDEQERINPLAAILTDQDLIHEHKYNFLEDKEDQQQQNTFVEKPNTEIFEGEPVNLWTEMYGSEPLGKDLLTFDGTLANLYAFSTQAFEEKENIVKIQELQTIEHLDRQSRKILLLDLVAGGGGFSVLYWLFNLQPIDTLQRAHMIMNATLQPRMTTGLELSLILSTIKSGTNIIKPLLAPMSILIGGSFAWWRIKKLLLAPYIAKYKSDIEKMKQLHLDHRNEMRTALKIHAEQTQAGIAQARANATEAQIIVAQYRDQMTRELLNHEERIRAEIAQARMNAVEAQSIVAQFSDEFHTGINQLQSTKKEIIQRNEELIDLLEKYNAEQAASLRKENKTLHQTLKKEQEQLVNRILPYIEGLQECIASIGDDVSSMRPVQDRLSKTVEAALPQIELVLEIAHRLEQKSRKTAEYLEHEVSPVQRGKNLFQQLGDRFSITHKSSMINKSEKDKE